MNSLKLSSMKRNWLQWDLCSYDRQSYYLNSICSYCDQKVKDQADEFHHHLSQQWIIFRQACTNEAVYWIWRQEEFCLTTKLESLWIKAVCENLIQFFDEAAMKAWIHLLSVRCWAINEQILSCLSHSICW